MNTKQKSMIIGAVLGAGLGALGGFLFTRDLEADEEGNTRSISMQSVRAGDVVKLLIATLGVLRGVAELGKWT